MEPLVGSAGQVLYLVAEPELQRRLVTERGPGASSRTSDAARAHENRLRRDELLADRIRRGAAERSFAVIEVGHPAETQTAIESHFRPALEAWLARGDRGDVAARRREENEARLRQWSLHAERVPAAGEAELPFACECDTPGCVETVPLTLAKATHLKAPGGRILAHPAEAPGPDA